MCFTLSVVSASSTRKKGIKSPLNVSKQENNIGTRYGKKTQRFVATHLFTILSIIMQNSSSVSFSCPLTSPLEALCLVTGVIVTADMLKARQVVARRQGAEHYDEDDVAMGCSESRCQESLRVHVQQMPAASAVQRWWLLLTETALSVRESTTTAHAGLDLCDRHPGGAVGGR
jgi:hypothetical protein